jgi:CBS domain-containing protein
VIAVPVVGGVLVGLMAFFGSDKIRGHGIPEAIEAILFGKSKMSAKVAVLKPISSGTVIGSGGPFGAEGPIIMTGGTIGSLLARGDRLRGRRLLPPAADRLRALVSDADRRAACGRLPPVHRGRCLFGRARRRPFTGRPPHFATPGESCRSVATRRARDRLERLPVVKDAESMELVGLIARSDLIKPSVIHFEEEEKRERLLGLPWRA